MKLRNTVLLALMGIALNVRAAQADDPGSQTAQKSRCDADIQATTYQAILSRDQAPRNRYMAELSAANPEHRQERLDQIAQEVLQADSENQSHLDDMVAACGWPSSRVFADSNLEAAFLTVQHAPLPFQLKYQARLRHSYETGQIPAHVYVLFEKRVKERQGGGQTMSSK